MDKIKKFFKDLPSNFIRFNKSDQGITLISSITCVILGILVGLVVLLLINPGYAFTGLIDILTGAFILPSSTAIAISNVAPLILVGLSVTFAYKCGLFNIGVAGQYLIGIVGCLYPAIAWDWHWILCLMAGGILAGLWGVIPGLLKAFCNVNEVISSIMTNWIALYAVNDIIKDSSIYDTSTLHTFYLTGNSLIPDVFGWSEFFGLYQPIVTLAPIIAILFAIGTFIFLNKTKYGYELRACGLNKDAAKYAGINHKKNIVMSMGIAGAFAGFAAGLYFLSNAGQYNPNISSALPSMGFDGISVALIGALNPIGGIFSAILLAVLSRGSTTINTNYFPIEMASLIFGIIIYLCAFNDFFKTKITNIIKKLGNKDKVKDNKKTINLTEQHEDVVLKEVEEYVYLQEIKPSTDPIPTDPVSSVKSDKKEKVKKEETKEEVKEETKEEVKEETKEEVKEETKEETKKVEKEEVKEELKEVKIKKLNSGNPNINVVTTTKTEKPTVKDSGVKQVKTITTTKTTVKKVSKPSTGKLETTKTSTTKGGEAK